MVGRGRHSGHGAPQVRQPTTDVHALLEELDRDEQKVATKRWFWAQPWYSGVMTREDWQTKMQRWERPELWQPLRHPSMCMSAAGARHVLLWSDEQIGRDMLELPGTKDARSDDVAPRFRSIDAMVSRGDELWVSLGAWPWVAFEDGHPPAEWWMLREPLDALQHAVAAHEIASRERLTKVESLSASLKERALQADP